MAVTKIATTDYIVAQGHPTFADIKNRASRELHAKIIKRHDVDGGHYGLSSICFGTSSTFEGDGTTGRTLLLPDTDLIPKVVIVQELPGAKDVEFLTNGGFESDMTGWTVSTTGTGSATGGVAGGQSGNCCQFSMNVSVPASVAIVQSITKKVALPVKGTIYVKCTDAALISAGQTFRLNLTGADEIEEILPADWTQYTIYGYTEETLGVASFSFSVAITAAGTWSGIYFDTASVVEAYSYNALAVRTDTMTDSYFRETVDPFDPAPYNLIGEVGTKGEIEVSANVRGGGINTDGITNSYFVLGVHDVGTYTGDAGGTDPDWVEDGEQMLGGTAGTEPGNRVEKHIDDAILVAHDADGDHTTNPFTGYMQIETGTFTGTGGGPIVTLQNAEMTIRELIVFDVTFGLTYTTTSDLYSPSATYTKVESLAALSTTSGFSSIGDGWFGFRGVLGREYHWIALGD